MRELLNSAPRPTTANAAKPARWWRFASRSCWELDRSIGDVCEIGEYGGLNSNEDKASMLVIYKWHIMVLAEMY